MLRFLLCGALAAGFLAGQTYNGAPLLKARLALETARARVLDGRLVEAPAALRQASRALADYALASTGPRAATAEFLRGEIVRYEDAIAVRPDDILDHIDLWLQPIDRWEADLGRATPASIGGTVYYLRRLSRPSPPLIRYQKAP